MKQFTIYLSVLLCFIVNEAFGQKVLPHKELGNWGFIDAQAFQKASAFDYKTLTPLGEGMYFATKRDKNTLFDASAKQDSFYIFNNAQLVYQDIFSKEIQGYDPDFGESTVDYAAQVRTYSEGLCAVRKDKLWGYLDKNGKWIIPPKYDRANEFCKGYAIVSENETQKLIDKAGKELKINQPNLIPLGTFESGLVLFTDAIHDYGTGNYYFIDKQGRVKIDVQKLGAEYATPFQNGFAVVGKHTNKDYYIEDFTALHGVIDTKGKIIIPIQYRKIDFYEQAQVFAVHSNKDPEPKEIQFYNPQGKLITDKIYNEAEDLGEERIAVFDDKTKKWGMIDLQGQEIIQSKYEYMYPFQRGKALVKTKSNIYTFINKNGQELFEHSQIFFVDTFYDFPQDEFTTDERLFNLNPIKFEDKIGFIVENTKAIFPEYDEYKDDFSEAKSVDSLLIAAQKNGKWGYIDAAGNTKIDFKYDDAISFFSPTYTAVKKGDKWGFMGRNGVEMGKFEYDKVIPEVPEDKISPMNSIEYSGLYQVQKNGKWGLANHTGKTYLPCEYDQPFVFKDGKSIAQKAGKVGIINYSNTAIVPFKYEEIREISLFNEEDFMYAHYLVKANGKYGYLAVSMDKDQDDILVLPTQFDALEYFDGEYAKAKQNGKYGLLDNTGKTAVNLSYDSIEKVTTKTQYTKDLLVVVQNNLKGIYNFKTQQEILPCQYEKIWFTYGDEIGVFQNNKKGYFSLSKQKMLIPCEYDNILYNYGKAMIAQKNEKYGLIDLEGKAIIKFKYDSLDFQYNESEMHVLAMQKNKWGAFDDKGQLMVSLKYDELGRLFLAEDRPIGVKENGKWGFINPKGKLILPYQYQDATCFLKVEMQDGTTKFFAFVMQNNKWGLIEESGNFVIEPRYEGIDSREEGKYDTRNGGYLNGKYIYFDFLGNEYERRE